MEASVSFHHKSFTQIDIHSKQQQVEVPLINVFFMLVPVLMHLSLSSKTMDLRVELEKLESLSSKKKLQNV